MSSIGRSKENYVSGNLNITHDVIADGNTLFVDADNNRVGIKTLTPSHCLDVNGDINFTGTLYDNGTTYSGSNWDKNGTDLSYANNVGIGITNPTEKLEVNGNVKGTEIISDLCSGNGSLSMRLVGSADYSSLANNVWQTETDFGQYLNDTTDIHNKITIDYRIRCTGSGGNPQFRLQIYDNSLGLIDVNNSYGYRVVSDDGVVQGGIDNTTQGILWLLGYNTSSAIHLTGRMTMHINSIDGGNASDIHWNGNVYGHVDGFSYTKAFNTQNGGALNDSTVGTITYIDRIRFRIFGITGTDNWLSYRIYSHH
jgi:hypothetical protein